MLKETKKTFIDIYLNIRSSVLFTTLRTICIYLFPLAIVNDLVNILLAIAYSKYTKLANKEKIVWFLQDISNVLVLVIPVIILLSIIYVYGNNSFSGLLRKGRYKGFITILLSITVFIMFVPNVLEGKVDIFASNIFRDKYFEYFLLPTIMAILAAIVFKNIRKITVLNLFTIRGRNVDNTTQQIFLLTSVLIVVLLSFAVLKEFIFSLEGNFVVETLHYKRFLQGLFEDIFNFVFKSVPSNFAFSMVVPTLILVIFINLFTNKALAFSDSAVLRWVFVPSILGLNSTAILSLALPVSILYVIPILICYSIGLLIYYLVDAFTMVHFMSEYRVFMPIPYHEDKGIMPLFLSGYLYTNSLIGVFLQIIMLVINVVIFNPFIRFFKQMVDHQFKLQQLNFVNDKNDSFILNSFYLVQREDNVGYLIRSLCLDLREALANKELFLVYQPKVNFKDKKIDGFEALIRWNHKLYGFIAPPVIVAIADEAKVLEELGLYVVEGAVKQMDILKKAGFTDITMSVNFSMKELKNFRIIEKTVAIIKRYNIEITNMEIELTENVELILSKEVLKTIKSFSQNDIPIAIDDFGVGHSGIMYLKHLGIFTVKIDKAISFDIVNNVKMQAILSTMLDMCNSFNIKLLIEFVDNPEQLDFLVAMGCNHFQGYIFSPPLKGEDTIKVLRQVEESGEMIYEKNRR